MGDGDELEALGVPRRRRLLRRAAEDADAALALDVARVVGAVAHARFHLGERRREQQRVARDGALGRDRDEVRALVGGEVHPVDDDRAAAAQRVAGGALDGVALLAGRRVLADDDPLGGGGAEGRALLEEALAEERFASALRAAEHEQPRAAQVAAEQRGARAQRRRRRAVAAAARRGDAARRAPPPAGGRAEEVLRRVEAKCAAAGGADILGEAAVGVALVAVAPRHVADEEGVLQRLAGCAEFVQSSIAAHIPVAGL